jgi:hypothetical protein
VFSTEIASKLWWGHARYALFGVSSRHAEFDVSGDGFAGGQGPVRTLLKSVAKTLM